MAAQSKITASEIVEPGDDDAAELAKRHLVQPWPYAGSVGNEARALIGEGDGIYITDASGKRLIDGPAGMWCVNVGHRREELAKVMYDQAMAQIRLSIEKVSTEASSTGRRPKRSLRPPMIGAKKNCIAA